MEETKLLNQEEAVDLYKETVGLAKDIYNRIKTDKDFIEKDKNIIGYVERFVNQQYLNNDNILNLINIALKEDEYMYHHVVNVCIISIDIGIGLGYNRSELFELGVASILHDIGMIELYDIYTQPRRLTAEEYKKIKTHPLLGAEILKKFKNVPQKTALAASQEHERMNGSGYPYGLKAKNIEEYAKIIGLADVYEAMTHARPYRGRIHPYEALKQIIDAKDSFENRVIKVLVERICCPYPLGCYVELSTHEMGKVIKRNLKNSFRPVVEVSHNSNGIKLTRPRMVDLTEYPSIYIKKYLKEEKNQKTA